MIQPVNNTMPQAYQAMPAMQPYYATAPMMQPQNNAVKIDIINPQAGASQPAYNPYVMPQYSQYAMPTASAYPQYQPQAAAPMPMPQPVVLPQPVVKTEQQVINAPQAAPMPVPPAPQPTVQEAAPQPIEVKPETQAMEAAPAAPEVEAPTDTPVSVDLNQIVSKLNSQNLEEQLMAIENIAETANNNPQEATKLLDTQVMDALGNIIKKDTTQLQAPTPEQLQLRQKLFDGEKLTPEQTAEANKISELEVAERNKQYALYTIAILQKLLSSEVEKAQGTKVEMKDLPMINDVVQIAKADQNPMLRASALAALSYIASPENKALLTTMFEQSQKDSDENVRAVATEALNKLSQVQM